MVADQGALAGLLVVVGHGGVDQIQRKLVRVFRATDHLSHTKSERSSGRLKLD